MDGTFPNSNIHKRREMTGSGRIGALLVLVGIAVGLHVALFAALDAVAPLGSDHSGEAVLVIESDSQAQATTAEDAEIRRVIADAR